MAERAVSSQFSSAVMSSQPVSASSQMRYRSLHRASTVADPSRAHVQRRASVFSDTLSETRHSMRSSTDDLFFPKVRNSVYESPQEGSPWQSAPLALALLPAVAGLFFQNGSAVVTDASLLMLAAVFLNWSVRLPWEWYHSAQSMSVQLPEDCKLSGAAIVEEDDENNTNTANHNNHDGIATSDSPPGSSKSSSPKRPVSLSKTSTAESELHMHEMLALLACFLSPVVGAWVLHAIRSQLSRPSEGLVSNYNLTIFLLAAELRPLMHMIKLVQARTLHLQRIIHANPFEEKDSKAELADLGKRVSELEAHVVRVASEEEPGPSSSSSPSKGVVVQITGEVRRALKPDIDAVNRAMRRLDKRGTLEIIQTEAKFRDLESRMQDAITLAAAAERGQHQNFAMILLNWISAGIVLPIHLLLYLTRLPRRIVASCINYVWTFFGFGPATNKEPKIAGKRSRSKAALFKSSEKGSKRGLRG